MRDDVPSANGGLPDATGGRGGEERAPVDFEPSEEQLERFERDLEAIADGVRPHLTGGFAVSTRVTSASGGPQGRIVVRFPTGEAIGSNVELTSEMFESTDDAEGPIPPDEIETASRRIATLTIAQWASAHDAGDDGVPPAT